MSDRKLTARGDLNNEHIYFEISGEEIEEAGLWVSKAHAAALAEYLTRFCEAVDGLIAQEALVEEWTSDD